MEHRRADILTAAQVASYRAQGFVQGPSVLEPAEADTLRRAIESIVTDPSHPQHDQVFDMGTPGSPLLHLKNLWAIDPRFRALLDHPMIARSLQELTGRSSFRLWQDGFFYKPPITGSAHGWHQDIVHIPVDRASDSVGVWLALTDVLDGSSGAMTMIPGSHLGGDAFGALDDLALPGLAGPLDPLLARSPEAETCLMERGYVHFHDGLTWHGSVANSSPEPRCGLLMFFVDDRCEYDPSHAAAVPGPEGTLAEADHPRIGAIAGAAAEPT